MPLPSPVSDEELVERFTAVTEFLATHRVLWTERPFIERRVAWRDTHPEIHRGFQDLAIDVVEEAEAGRFPDALPPAALAIQEEAKRLTLLPRLDCPPPPGLTDRAPRRVPARKWRQIHAFVGPTLPHLADATRLVDWCAGKGHLGRTLAGITGHPLDAIERDPALCGRGTEECVESALDGTFHPLDATSDAAHEVVGPGSAVVGLHACGVLSEVLLETSVARGAAAAIHAPCCYHALGGDSVRTPRSRIARAADLPLTSEQLRLATTDEVVARPSVRSARRREMRFRLGLDLLLREASGDDIYLPQGPFPRSLLDQPFESFCHEASTRLERDLPPSWSPVAAEEAGRERAREARALGLVRGMFRRVMELHVVLDRALWMHEQGQEVRLGVFCASEVTPRNIWMSSRPTGGQCPK